MEDGFLFLGQVHAALLHYVGVLLSVYRRRDSELLEFARSSLGSNESSLLGNRPNFRVFTVNSVASRTLKTFDDSFIRERAAGGEV